MAKLKPDPIMLTDLEEYLVEYSDFSFEMSVLQALEHAHFSCDHSGVYTDPVSGKIRQFDIRAWRKHNGLWLWLTVECKNLRQGFPLLVHTVPRSASEAFHEVLVFTNERSMLPGL